MLFLTGALDNVSVVVRQTLVQVLTPDAMRGRVSAVNAIFIGSSNELGEFESGLAARLFGAVPAVVGGGVGTILVVLGVATSGPAWSTRFAARRVPAEADGASSCPRPGRVSEHLSPQAHGNRLPRSQSRSRV